MEQGSLRCDVNVSVHRDGKQWGTRTEIKNVNSVRFIMNAVAFEMHRQIGVIEAGGDVTQETRGYDEETGSTFSLRSKEEAMDYRYMPDPNLPPLNTSEEKLTRLREEMPELLDATRDRMKLQYSLSPRDMNIVLRLEDASRSAPEKETIACPSAIAYFEAVAKGREPQIVANWMINELVNVLGDAPFYTNPVPAERFGELIDLVISDQITGSVAKALLAELAASSHAPDLAQVLEGQSEDKRSLYSLLKTRGQLSLDKDELRILCRDIVTDPKLGSEVEAVRKGKQKVMMRLVGEVMKRAKGRADAALATKMLQEELLTGK